MHQDLFAALAEVARKRALAVQLAKLTIENRELRQRAAEGEIYPESPLEQAMRAHFGPPV